MEEAILSFNKGTSCGTMGLRAQHLADALKSAHRAALLCVWRGALGNEPEKYPGLREALEGMVSQSIGNDDIPLNPTIQKGAATAFSDISAALR